MDTVVISDTNIFIDLYNINLLEAFFSLPLKIHTTDFVLNELTDIEQKANILKFIKTKKLFLKKNSPQEIMEIAVFHSQRENNVSMTDCSVWMYAHKNKYELLTGDNKLKKSAIKSGVNAHGILYIIDLLVETHKIISPEEGADKLSLLVKKNNRLPSKEIQQRIQKWSNSIMNNTNLKHIRNL